MDVFAGLDLGGSSLKYGYGNKINGLLLFSRQSHSNQGRKELYDLCTAAIHHIKGSLLPGYSLAGISLGSPGYIDPVSGEILANSPNLQDWVGANPKRFLEDCFAIPVYVENDANLMAYGEANTPQRKSRTILGITIGTGIGGGLIFRDRIYHGSLYAAMEMGHIIIEPHGLKCSCGKSGCLEVYASIQAMEREAESLTNQSLTIEKILSLSRDNDDFLQIIMRAYDRIGTTVANAVALLDPHIVVIGGGLTECPSFQIEPLIGAVKQYLNDYHQERIIIETALLKNKAAVWGGIVLAEMNG